MALKSPMRGVVNNPLYVGTKAWVTSKRIKKSFFPKEIELLHKLPTKTKPQKPIIILHGDFTLFTTFQSLLRCPQENTHKIKTLINKRISLSEGLPLEYVFLINKLKRESYQR